MLSSPDALELEVMEQVHIRSAKRMAVSLDTEIYKDLGLYGMDVSEIAHYLHKNTALTLRIFEWAITFPQKPVSFGDGFGKRLSGMPDTNP